MGASCGGEVYIFHARIIWKDVRMGVKLALNIAADELEKTREFIKNWYGCERVFSEQDGRKNGIFNKCRLCKWICGSAT